ncbi:hypothetical protein, partial [Mycobacterium canetti]|uniref:hypothetical protein n=1 Tax=Mycobacterium canetti TaxID=78331 RepID=UPI001E595252
WCRPAAPGASAALAIGTSPMVPTRRARRKRRACDRHSSWKPADSNPDYTLDHEEPLKGAHDIAG